MTDDTRPTERPGLGEASAPEDGVPQAVRVRRLIGGALDRTRRQLAQDEDEYRRVHDELQIVLASKGRRAFLAVRGTAVRALRVAVSPRRWVQALAAPVIGLAGRAARLSDALRHARARTAALRFEPPVEQRTDQPVPGDAIRWLGPLHIAGRTRHALFCHPESAVTFRMEDAAGARLTAWAALLPPMWERNPDGVEFVLSARADHGSWQRETRRLVRPRTRTSDRRWRALRLTIPADVSGPVLVTLKTTLRPAASADSAWAVWGDPELEWARPISDVVRLTRANLRQYGIRGAWGRLQNQPGRDEERERYRRWLEDQTPGPGDLADMVGGLATLARRPLISVITPVYNTEPRWLVACIESVRRQVYPDWELCLADDASTSQATLDVLARYADDPRIRIVRLPRNLHISGASNAALDVARGEFVAMLDHDDELAPEALFEVVRCLNANPDADFIYSDEDKLEMNGQRCDPYFKPDWSPDLFRSFMYTNHLMVLRRSLVNDVGRFRVGFEGSQDYDLALRAIERTDRVVHVPKILYHWRKIPGSAAAETEAKPWALEAAKRALTEHLERRQVEAEVLPGMAPGLFRVRYALRDRPLVTIVVTTDDRTREVNGSTTRLLTNCLRSVVQKTAYANYEILVVDNGRLSDESAAFLARTPHRRVSYAYTGAFNFAHKLNFSVRHVRGEHLVIFNDDLEVIDSEWMTAMLEFSQQPEIGAVGARLLFPDGRLQHIGMVLGVCGVVAHAFHSAPGSSPGYGGSAMVVRNYSCVTGACLMTRREIFEALGGFNERLAIDFNDVDYCLRVRQAGYRIVYTPYAQLYHLESGSHGGRQQASHEIEEMRRTWGSVLNEDPYYNPNLTRDFPDHRIGA